MLFTTISIIIKLWFNCINRNKIIYLNAYRCKLSTYRYKLQYIQVKKNK